MLDIPAILFSCHPIENLQLNDTCYDIRKKAAIPKQATNDTISQLGTLTWENLCWLVLAGAAQ